MSSSIKNKYSRGKSNKKSRGKSNNKSKYNRNQGEDEQQQEEKRQVLFDKKTLLALKSDEQITKIKDYYKLIETDPENNFKHVDTIFIFIKSSNVKVATTAMRVLAEIFINTAPLEAVDMKQIEERKEVKITKDEFQVLKFQELLVNQYERYLKLFKELNSKLNVSSFESDTEMFVEFKKCMLQCLIKCYRTLWNFNHFKLLNEIMIKFVKYEECQAVLIQLLSNKNEATLKIKAKIINGIATLIKEKSETQLPDSLVKIVNSTYIDSRYLQKDQQILKFKKKKLTKKLYKQQEMQKKKDKQARKQREADKAQKGKGGLRLKAKLKDEKVKQKMKVREQVNKEFAQGDAVISNKQLVKSNSAILQEIFYIYFKIIVENVHSKYLKDSLDGILSFAHLINIDLITTLILYLDNSAQQLRQLWLNNKNNHVLSNRFFLIFTSESLLNGPLSVYNMDDLKVTTNLFKILRDINRFDVVLNKQHFKMIAITMQQMLLKRRQLSQEVVGSLLKELSLIILKKEIPKFYLLEVIRQIASKYSKITKMFQPDNQGFGLNSFNQHSEDPQSTNAINTEIMTNLSKLLQTPVKKSKRQKIDEQKQKVKQMIDGFVRLNFNRSEGCLSLADLLQNDLQIMYQKIN